MAIQHGVSADPRRDDRRQYLRVVVLMMEILRKSDGNFVIIHAGREVAKDFKTETDAWSWADENVDDQVFCTPNRLSASLEYRTPLPNLRAQ